MLPNFAGLNVLVVEDDVDTADSLATVLQMFGHRVRVELNGFAALAAARECVPDVAILDIGLPGMNGFEVAAELKKLQASKRPLLIAVSGYEQNQGTELASAVDLYLVKPAEPEMLCGILRRFQEALA